VAAKPHALPTWRDLRLWAAAVAAPAPRLVESTDSRRRLLAGLALSLLALTSLTLVTGAARARR
jgi:hypothetical protein